MATRKATQAGLEAALRALDKADKAFIACTCRACKVATETGSDANASCPRLLAWLRADKRVESIRSRL